MGARTREKRERERERERERAVSLVKRANEPAEKFDENFR